MVPRERTVWLRVSGVPVNAWSEEFFKYMFVLVWVFVRVDAAILEKLRLDFGRVLVSVTNPKYINKTVKVKINSDVLSI